MKPAIKKLYKEALKNELYNQQIREGDSKYQSSPNIFSSSALKHFYAAGYYGWLVGRREFNRSNYGQF